MSNPESTSSTSNVDHVSTASAELSKQPPFPEPGTSQEREPPVKHPHAEHLINSTIKHVMPDHPAPSADDDEDKADINKPTKREKEHKEEEPLLRGTPLEELMTPGIGLAAPPKTDTIEEEAGSSDDAKRQEATQKPGRPGFGAVRGVGSESVSSTTSSIWGLS
jgi:hypothetical protein